MTDFTGLWRAAARINGFEEHASDARFTRLYDLLTDAETRVNLTAIRDPAGIAVLHFADSLTAAREIPEGASLVDVGCGGGFPSLPLAIARPDLKITALDSTRKKLDFVGFAARELGLSNLTTLCGRAEELGREPAYRERFDCAVARAVAPLGALCELCLPLVRVGGSFIAMKSREAYRGEFESAAPVAGNLGGRRISQRRFILHFPEPDERGDPERVIVAFTKFRATPPAFPRRWSQIKSTVK